MRATQVEFAEPEILRGAAEAKRASAWKQTGARSGDRACTSNIFNRHASAAVRRGDSSMVRRRDRPVARADIGAPARRCRERDDSGKLAPRWTRRQHGLRQTRRRILPEQDFVARKLQFLARVWIAILVNAERGPLL